MAGRPSRPSAASCTREGLQTFSWKAEDPNGDTLVYEVPYRAVADDPLPPPAPRAHRAVLAWDTSTVPNGRYVVRIVARDAPSNPEALALTGEKDSPPFDVDNTPPTVTASLVPASRPDPRDGAATTAASSEGSSTPSTVDAGKRSIPSTGSTTRGRRLTRSPRRSPGRRTPRRRPACQDLLGNVATARSRSRVNVLVARAGALGDLLLLRRTFFALKRTGASISLLAPAVPGRALVGSGPADVNRLLPWDGPDATWLFGDEPRTTPAPETFDLALAYTRSESLVGRLAELAREVRCLDPQPSSDQEHASRWYARLLTGLGLDTETAPRVQAPSREEAGLARALVAGLPHRFLAVHPGSGSPRKNWPPDRYAALVGRVSSGCPWLLIEGPADAEAAGALGGVPGAVRLRDTPARVLEWFSRSPGRTWETTRA